MFYIEKKVWFLFAYRCFSSEYVPSGNDSGWLAVYSSRGPSVHDVTVVALTDRVQIGKPLLLEVSGYCQLAIATLNLLLIQLGVLNELDTS